MNGAASALKNAPDYARYLATMADITVPSYSLYIREDIGIQEKLDQELNQPDRLMGQITGVYVPDSVKTLDQVNVILYLHGDKVRIWDPTKTIRDYWSLPQLPLRQGVNGSGKPFILVAPTLGKKVAVEFGKIGSNIDTYLDDVMQRLQRLDEFMPRSMKPANTPKIADLIIAGHSGGYGPITEILGNIKKYKSNLKEIWGFDVMYSYNIEQAFVNAGVPVYAYFNDTENISRDLASKKNPRVFVMDPMVEVCVSKNGKSFPCRVRHDNLMMKFWADRCQRIGSNGSNPEDRKLMI
jgi:hypothetical protein